MPVNYFEFVNISGGEFDWQFCIRMVKELPSVIAQLKKIVSRKTAHLYDPINTPSISSIYFYNHLPPLSTYY